MSKLIRPPLTTTRTNNWYVYNRPYARHMLVTHTTYISKQRKYCLFTGERGEPILDVLVNKCYGPYKCKTKEEAIALYEVTTGMHL